MKKESVRFGTDGWRAVVAEDFTFDNVARAAAAVARALKKHKTKGKILVGHDRRFLAGEFARCAALALRAEGLDARITKGDVPTPAASMFLFRRRDYAAAVLLTASHNPPRYGGFKIKLPSGVSADGEFTKAVEKELPSAGIIEARGGAPLSNGKIPVVDVMPLYLSALRKFADAPLIRRAGLNVAVDAMHGSGGRILESLLHGGKTKVETLRAATDPLFGGSAPEPTEENLRGLARFVRAKKCGAGIALDGDADRLAFLDARGRFVSPQTLMAILADYLLREKKAAGNVAKTYAGTAWLDRIAAAHGRRCLVFPVGFKHVSRAMREENVVMGGEEAGGVGVARHMFDRDGIAVALLVLEIMARRKLSLSELEHDIARRYGALHYARKDFPLKNRLTPDANCLARAFGVKRFALSGGRLVRVETLDGVKIFFADGAWILFRASGTEPLLRVYAEAPSHARLTALMKAGESAAGGVS